VSRGRDVPDGSRGPSLTRHAVATDVGLVRANNEDSYLVAPPLFAVADGMGGHRAGEVASAGAVETLATEAAHDTDSLVAAVLAANKAVYAKAVASPDLAGMGTTITAMLATRRSVQIVHVGDSRAYLLREGRLRRLTQDHTVVDRLAREGKIPADEVDRHPQRSVLERALGVGPEIDVDVQLIDVHPGDRLLLCTDGLTSMLDDEEIREILLAERAPEVTAQRLVDDALQAGGKDNVTALVVDFPRHTDGPDPNATAEQPAVVLDDPLPPPRRFAQRGGPGGLGASATDVTAGETRVVGGRATTAPPVSPRHSERVAPPDDGPPVPRGFGRRPPGTKLLIAGAIIIPLVVIGLLGAWAAVRSSWYVGADEGMVAVFRGVPGSFGGIQLSSLSSKTNVAIASLPQAYQARVRSGMDAKGRTDAVRITDNLRQLEIPVSATVTPLASPPPSGSGAPPAPAGTGVPLASPSPAPTLTPRPSP
jgi:serine/threonine protein phosphatase PrpC